ncbi:MAG TPA: S16 family serine protease [Gaiellaceae bacterium]|jgi:PDZ domain-containing protein
MRRLLSPGRLLAAGIALLGLVFLVLWLTPSSEYIFLPDRARPVEPLVKIVGHNPKPGPGGIYFVDILVRKATLLERLVPHLHEGGELVPARDLQAPGQNDKQRHQADLRQMSRSQSIAAAVALRAAGYKVVARPTGALVDETAPGLPAAGLIQPTDVIVSIDGSPVRTVGDLRRLIRSHPVGAALRVAFRRGSELRSVTMKSVADPHQGGEPIIGVAVEQAADIHLPVSVRIDVGDVGGPSAGLAFALDVLEELGRDVDHGHRIAATGEIALDGSVGPIGGIVQKTIGVRRSGIDVFLVPAGDNTRAAKRRAGKVRIIPVQSFQQALRVLATLGRKG